MIRENDYEQSIRLQRERAVAHDPGTAIGPVHRLPSGVHEIQMPSALSPQERVPVARAVVLRWNPPPGRGPWLVVERGIHTHPYITRRSDAVDSTYLGYPDIVLISEVGVVVARRTTEVAATTEARRHRLAAHGTSGAFDVMHESRVEVVESDAPYGCNAGDRVAKTG